MRTPLQPVWDLALKHWDEVISSPADYAWCIEEANKQFLLWMRFTQDSDEWSDSDILMAAFYHLGYEEMIPGMNFDLIHKEINITLFNRYKGIGVRNA